ncbi:hypothetical protein O1Q96_30325 [Streptomyces sp. Qhu-G9]|uniref:hypothetical protein n=1 Tax=Streptomyces sp. Qhu-G9 TaxID=3452799 RepID=UPI0022AC7238|nr:hypothetical protein [Streptomyces aurantiacus]WAU83610.1 hypothetical protein O1Q96_30325 [Streptomyces aurantiacus]
MSDYGTRTPEEDGPVPRDLPDQQAQEGGDRWDVTPADPEQDKDSGEDGPKAKTDTEVPETDEAGTGRQPDADSSTVHPEDPEPQESPA